MRQRVSGWNLKVRLQGRRNMSENFNYVETTTGRTFPQTSPGALSVGIHHNGTNFICPYGRPMTVEDLASKIRSETDLSRYTYVQLFSCRKAKSINGRPIPAQQLFRLLSKPVQAATEYVWTVDHPTSPCQGTFGKTPDGKIDRTKPGEWIYLDEVGK